MTIRLCWAWRKISVSWTTGRTPLRSISLNGNPGPTGGSLKLGAATVINAPAGVNVRSGPGTENPAIASLVNGNNVTVKADAGNGWYEISFAGNGGVETAGYMKGEYLKNP